ncbi:MAG: hypothetical protein ACRDGL_10930 [Candidatus Limnocylindrales bacterium]
MRRTLRPTTFQFGPAPWTLALPGLPIALGGAIAVWEVVFDQRPLGGAVLLLAGLIIFWMRECSRVRIVDGRLAMRWFWPAEQSVDLDRLIEAKPARIMTLGQGALNVLRLRDHWGAVVDLPLDRWAREAELRSIIAAAAQYAGV